MNRRVIFHVISFVLFFLFLGMLVAVGVSVLSGDPMKATIGLGLSAAITGVVAVVLWWFTRGEQEALRLRDCYAVVSFGWLSAAVFCTLPYVLSGGVTDIPSAFFESMSGITATGATIMTDIDSHTRGLLFFRASTQWLGGMGVLVLVIAIIPFSGASAKGLISLDSGAAGERLTPRIVDTARILWYMYLVFTALCIGALKLCGMDWFDAVCHSFCTIATGGFSTHTQSIAYFDSVAIEMVIMVFMVLSGMSFALHFRVLRGGPLLYLRDSETRFMWILLAVCSLVMAVALLRAPNEFTSFPEALRASSFECIAVLTTTGFGGYGTQSFPAWGIVAVVIVAVLTFFGGCAGSTSGGMKLVRILLMVKGVLRELKRMVLPRGMHRVRNNKEVVEEETLAKAVAFLGAFVLIAAFSSVVMTYFAPDAVTAVSSVCATITNVGPGVGPHVGPEGSFAVIDAPGKFFLSFLMLLGRLELFTLMVIFTPLFWRK